MARIQGARVDASVPGWLINAAATHVAIDQIKRVAHELAARPDAYGFDPDAIYTLFFQTWDRSSTSVRSVAFGRDCTGQSAVGLLPDPYYMHARGYRTLCRAAGSLPVWADRSDQVAWRGSVTGDNTIALPEDLPRIRLAMLARDRPDMDVGLIGVHSTMNNGRAPGALDSFVEAHGLTKARWDMSDFGRYKYTIDIDGHANAWGLLEKFIVGCCVLKVASPYEQWFYDRMKPWHHYIPVRADLSDLSELMAWCRDNEAQSRWIAQNGTRLAASLTLDQELPAMCKTVLAAAHARRATRPHRPTVATPRFLLEDAAARAEDRGDLDHAIAAYTRLIDSGDTRWESLMRRHDFLRQRGDFAAAAADMAAAVTAQPASDEPPLRLAQFLALIGRHGAAVELFDQARARAPDRHEIAIALAGSCLKLGWLDRAYWAVRSLPDDLPGWWADVRRDAIAAYQAARTDAVALLDVARRAAGVSPDQRWELARRLTALGRTNAARKISDALPSDFPTLAQRRALTLAIVLRQQGPAAALQMLEDGGDAGDAGDADTLGAIELLYELGAYQPVLERIQQAGIASAPPQRLEIAACSAAMLGRSADLVATCSVWLERAPHDYKPAELLCGAHPIVAINPSARADRHAPLEIGAFWPNAARPGLVEAAMESWTDHHRTARLHIFDAAHARAFLDTHYGAEMVRAFDLCAEPETQAQYFRFAWLHHTGGCWVGSDQRCIRSVSDILARAAASDFATIRSGHMKGYLQDSWIGAKRGSPLIEGALAAATDAIVGAAARGEALWGWGALGAGLLTRLTATAICRTDHRSDIVLLAPMTYDSFAATVHRG